MIFPLLATLFWVFSIIGGGEMALTTVVAPLSYNGSVQTRLSMAGVDIQKTWGSGDFGLVTGVEMGIDAAIYGVATAGVKGNLVASNPFRLDYFLLPEAGVGTDGFGEWSIFGAKGLLEGSLALGPRFFLFADLGLEYRYSPELSLHRVYMPLGLGMKYRFEKKK
jgi:hypothetical protein